MNEFMDKRYEYFAMRFDAMSTLTVLCSEWVPDCGLGMLEAAKRRAIGTTCNRVLTYTHSASGIHYVFGILAKNKTRQGKTRFVLSLQGNINIKNQGGGFRATSLSTYDFSTLYTTLSHNLIKEKLLDLIERAFKKIFKNEGTLYLVCNDKKAFFTSTDGRGYKLWSCQNICDALSYLLDNIYIRYVISYTEQLLVSRWVQIVLLL